MLNIIQWQSLTAVEKKQSLARPILVSNQRDMVNAIIDQVKDQGDRALLALTKQYDDVDLKTLLVPSETINAALTSPKALEAMQTAMKTIRQFQCSLPEKQTVFTAPGVALITVYRPIQKIGLYVPGGNKTPLISTLLMLAVPAQSAGCPVKVLCTPPNDVGEIDANLLVAAKLCGIDTIYTIGGAQAIAAMAYGTQSIPKVDKIFGPGNSYVTEAKSIVSCDPYGAAIDMPAGPSEVMVIADQQANPAFVAADLLAQAEHGVDSQVILICETETFATQVNQEIRKQLPSLTRQSLIEQSLASSRIIVCPDRSEQLAIINDYAPEHLIINRCNAKEWINEINAAGTVFLGPWAAETMGDYVTGSSHVLPTYGYARNHNGLNILDFMTRFTVQSITEMGVKTLGPTAVTLALLEGLDAHARAVQLRLAALEN